MQQHLPFTVLKLALVLSLMVICIVATALTVYGIETRRMDMTDTGEIARTVATALTVYGIET